MKKINSILILISLATHAIAGENTSYPLVTNTFHEEPQLSLRRYQSPASILHKKILYGSLSIAPGAGLSVRERKKSKGSALDYKLGVFPFAFDTMSLLPVVSIDYNFLYFSKDQAPCPYFSWGIGAVYIIPYIPLRGGIEFKSGFIDIGAKLLLGYIPSPEIRAGFDLEY
jgi:hypothetical protein